MVLNKQGLERAYTPIKHRRHSGQRRSLNKVTRPGSSTSQTCSNMKVVVRIRPQNVKEFENNCRSIVNVVDDNLLIFDPKEEAEPFFFHGAKQTCRDIQKKQNKALEFTFDKVFGCTSTNEDVFKGSTEAIVKSLLDGYNCSVFAYGATGAGKTYTMLGNERYPGITYLTIVDLYKEMENLSADKEFELGVSHLEVYNENVRDLIKPSGTLHIQEASYGIRIPGLSVHRIASADELFTLMALGNKNRTQHPTDANAESSRSHSVFQLYIKMTTKLNKNVKIMKLSMIDLAGSERGSATGCKGMRFTEGANINKSLLALGNCINNLADGLKHIPYRDSKLTRLLKDSLGGNCRTVMIANASPSSSCYEDTYNTLKYATRAKNIKQTIKKNVVFVNLPAAQYAKIVESLTAENEALKVKLRMYETGNIPSSAVSVAPVTCTADAVELKEKLSTLYEEKSDINKEILKLGKEIKVLKWRNHTKQTIVDRLPHLSINCTVLNKRIDRIQKSMKQLEGRTASYQKNLKEAFVKWNDNGEKINSLMTKLGSGSYTDLEQHVTNSQLQLEVQEKQMQLEHCHQLLQMQHNDMESQETIIRELCTTFKQYHILLQGHDKMTNAMSSHYEDLVHKLEGIKNISWKNDSETLDCCNLKYSMQNIADLSVQNLHVEGIAGVESSESLPTENKITFKAVNCYDQGNIAESSTCPDMELKRVESCALNQINSLENSEASNVSTVMAAKTNENCEAAVSLPVILKEDILVPPVHRETLEDITDQSSSLNGTFVLSKALISNFQESSAQLPVDKNEIQTKTYFRVNKSRAVKKRNDFRFVGSQCNKENGTPVDRRPTASHLGDRYYGNKNKNFALPNQPQLRTSNFSVNRAPLQPQKYSPFVMKQEMGRMKKSHINKSHPYSQNYNYY